MPTTKSAKKALKRSETNRSRNRHFSELYKESVKTLERAVAAKSGNFIELLADVYSKIDTLAKKHIIHPNNAARRKSSFAKLVNAAPATEAPAAAPKKAPAKKAAAPKAEKAPAKKVAKITESK